MPLLQIFEEVMKFYNLGHKTFETDFSNFINNGHMLYKYSYFNP